MKKSSLIGFTLVIAGLALVVSVALLLVHSEKVSEYGEWVDLIAPGDSVRRCFFLDVNESVKVSISSNQSINIFLSGVNVSLPGSTENLLFSREGVEGEVINFTPNNRGNYCLILQNLGGGSALVRTSMEFSRTRKMEEFRDLLSLSGVCLMLVGSAILVRDYMGLYSAKFKDEIAVPGGVCKSRSFNRHRCVVEINARAEEVLVKAVSAFKKLGYEVAGGAAPTVAVMKRRQRGIVPVKYEAKPVTVVISVKELTPTSSRLQVDFEIPGTLSSGSLDLAGVAKDVAYVIKFISRKEQP
ncbi:MAG: hypothetical protein J7L12_00985 [Desulfurococcales archaeon]|nr:hypothetical protein [Desulfurococcales archaeon]